MRRFQLTCAITKLDDELRIVKGPVLRPGIRDRQGSMISEAVIREAAHDFMLRYRLGETGSGFMHKDFENRHNRFQIVESYIVDVEYVVPRSERSALDVEQGVGDISVPAGSWVMAVKVIDDDVWKMIKNGTVKGFSIGGTARRVYSKEVEPGQEAA
jgi:DNA adenine methylase